MEIRVFENLITNFLMVNICTFGSIIAFTPLQKIWNTFANDDYGRVCQRAFESFGVLSF